MKNNPPPQKTKSETSGLNKRHPVLAFILLGLAILIMPVALQAATPASPAAVETAVKARLIETYGKLPLSFEENQGQTGDQVKFLSRGPGYTLFLTPSEAVLSLHKPEAAHQKQPPLPSRERAGVRGKGSDSTSTVSTALRIQLVGANPKPQSSGLEKLPGKVNYFRGKDPKQWHTNIPIYAKVKYVQVYPGIDLIYYGRQRQLEYDFVVAPGANPEAIRLAFDGAGRLDIDSQDDLVLRTAGGEVRLHKPLVYQEIDGKRREIDGRFVLHRLPLSAGESRREDDSNIQVGFQLAAYDHTKPLVIDPVLVYSSYLGGSGNDVSTAIAVDSSNNTYITGYTQSGDFPTKGGSLSFGGLADVFITKLNAGGTELIYSAILGGSKFDYGHGITIDSGGSAYITGYTESADFPTTPEAFDTSYNGDFRGDVFIAKLNAEGNALAYSTYLGGDDYEYGYDIAVDSSGNAYVTGYTESPDFPTAIPYQGSCVRCFADDAFVTKLNAAGSALVYSTYLGGDNRDRGFGIAVDGTGSAYVVGGTSSNNFPTKIGSFDTIYNGGNNDAFVSKFNVTGTDLVYSTYLGGNSYDCINNTVGLGCDIAIDSANNAHVVGITASSNFPTTPDAYDVAHNGGTYDAFVTKLNANGSQLLYSTYLGGSDYDCYPGFGGRCEIAVDGAGNAYVAGNTSSADFPTTPGALSTGLKGSSDAFLVKFNTTGSLLTYSTYLGGSRRDCFEGCGFAINSSGDVYLTGSTDSSDFPTTPGAFDTSRNGFSDAFVAKISFDDGTPPPPVTAVYLLLHGTASDPTTWDDLVTNRFAGHCPVTELGQNLSADSVCYRVEFADIPIGDIWTNGDGSKFDTLGVEVGVAIRKIEDRMHPAAIILVGHSRGGLAARAYLQKITQQPPFKLGLLTIGTPHQGTPLGRVKHCLTNKRCLGKSYTPDDVPEKVIRAICRLPGTPPPTECVRMFKANLFSPSAGHQATAHNRAGKPVSTSISAEIHALNAGAHLLDDWVLTFGQIYSHNLRLGQNIVGPVDLLDNGSVLGRWLVAGRFSKLRSYVLKNIVSRINLSGASFCVKDDRTINNWACNGDGVAPTISQRLTRLPGFSRGSKPLHSLSVKGVSHIKETRRTGDLNSILDAMENDLR